VSIFAEELKALDMSAAGTGAEDRCADRSHHSNLNGTHAITGDIALRLSHFFGTSAQSWLNLQTLYDRRLAHKKPGDPSKHFPG
jgi:antitoxin HigA-1